MKYLFIILLVFFSNTLQAEHSKLADVILERINAFRMSQHKKKLINNEQLSYEARLHSQAMAEGKVPFGHSGLQIRFQNCLRKLNRNKGTGAENIAYSYKMNAQAVVRSWLNSPYHLANLNGDYKLTGIGIAQDKQGKFYCTQLFIK